MKLNVLASSVLALVISSASISALAADAGSGTIEFKGAVNTGACTIVPSSLTKEVGLGSVPVASLKTAGNQGPVNDFALELTNCILENGGEDDPDYSKVTVTFTGQMDGAGTLWANSGTASNMGVLFENENGVALKNNQTVQQDLTAGNNTINLSARMQSLGNATAGSVKSTVAYVLTYQ